MQNIKNILILREKNVLIFIFENIMKKSYYGVWIFFFFLKERCLEFNYKE